MYKIHRRGATGGARRPELGGGRVPKIVYYIRNYRFLKSLSKFIVININVTFFSRNFFPSAILSLTLTEWFYAPPPRLLYILNCVLLPIGNKHLNAPEKHKHFVYIFKWKEGGGVEVENRSLGNFLSIRGFFEIKRWIQEGL